LDISPPLGDVSLQETISSRVDADVIMASV
jgi:hypothetical protein